MEILISFTERISRLLRGIYETIFVFLLSITVIVYFLCDSRACQKHFILRSFFFCDSVFFFSFQISSVMKVLFYLSYINIFFSKLFLANKRNVEIAHINRDISQLQQLFNVRFNNETYIYILMSVV